MKIKILLSTTMVVGFIVSSGLAHGTQATVPLLAPVSTQDSLIPIRYTKSHHNGHGGDGLRRRTHSHHHQGSKVNKHRAHKHHHRGRKIDKYHHRTQVGKRHLHRHGNTIDNKRPVQTHKNPLGRHPLYQRRHR